MFGPVPAAPEREFDVPRQFPWQPLRPAVRVDQRPLIVPAFRLLMFGVIACYVELLVAQGHTLAGALTANVLVALTARASIPTRTLRLVTRSAL